MTDTIMNVTGSHACPATVQQLYEKLQLCVQMLSAQMLSLAAVSGFIDYLLQHLPCLVMLSMKDLRKTFACPW